VCRTLKSKLVREALEGFLGFFRWLVLYGLFNLTSSTFYSCQNLLSCTTILVHHVLPYVMVPYESHVRDGWNLFQWEPTSRLCLATFCHTWTFCITKIRGRDALYSIGECLRLDTIHAAALRMDVVSIVKDNECGCFHECWHERFWMFCDFL
jgi:hypothetical protein